MGEQSTMGSLLEWVVEGLMTSSTFNFGWMFGCGYIKVIFGRSKSFVYHDSSTLR